MARSRSRTTASRRSGCQGCFSPTAQPRGSPGGVPRARMLLVPPLSNPLATQQPGDAVQRVTFADRAQVDFDAAPPVAHRSPVRVERDVPHTDALQGGGQLVVRRHAALATEEAPGLDERAGGNIEGTAR